jgi:NADH:ubiquinone oxidoreductase subunit 2 (subunit N)
MGRSLLVRYRYGPNRVGPFGLLQPIVVISVYFYVHVIVSLFMSPGDNEAPPVQPGIFGAVLSGCILVGVILLGIFPAPVLSLISEILYSV